MRLSRLPVVAATLFIFASSTGAYVLDKSCDRHRDILDPMIDMAFLFAENALFKVKAPHDEQTTMLLQNLFGVQGNFGASIISGTLESQNQGQTKKGMLSFKDKVEKSQDQYHELERHQPVIFCDESRLKRFQKEAASPLYVYDTVGKFGQSKKNFSCSVAFAWTTLEGANYDTIQLCPWFLNYVRLKKIRSFKDIRSLRALSAVAGVDKLITNKFYTPIDLFMLWDKTLFHEFMHTTAAGAKDDVGGFRGYGWKNCKKLASENQGQARMNADTHAIFGAASYYATSGSPIDANGNFTNGQPRSKEKRWPHVGSFAANARREYGS